MGNVYGSILRGIAEVEAHLKGEHNPDAVVHVLQGIDATSLKNPAGIAQTNFEGRQSPIEKLVECPNTSKRRCNDETNE